MLVSRFVIALSWALGVNSVAPGLAPLHSNLQIRNSPGLSSSQTLRALRETLSSAIILKRDRVFRNSTSLDTSWNDEVLFSFEGEAGSEDKSLAINVTINCVTCYIKGTATAQLTISGNFNASQAFHNVTSEIGSEIHNISTAVVDYVKTNVESFVKNATKEIVTGEFHIDDIDFPPIQVDFDIDVPRIPECDLRIQFEDLELYMEIDTSLSRGTTYTVNLYTSNGPIGFAVDSELLVGVVFSVDLLLSAEDEIDISSGFHIQLDGVAIDISMFDKNVSKITFDGGNFEFLPVIIHGANVTLTAILRIGVRAGLDFSTPTATIEGVSLGFSSGIESGVWADIAQFVTNVTAAPVGDNSECELRVFEEYSMLLGANAGATLAIGDHTWGPAPSTQIPIWYTSLGDACAATRSATVTANIPSITARDDLSTTTKSTELTYTATACLSTGLVNCPASLQSTSRVIVTTTLVESVPSGSKPSFVVTAQTTPVNAIAFGSKIHAITATTGSPVSYVPTASPTSTPGSSFIHNGETAEVSNKIIIGISVGVGVPVLIAIMAGCLYCIKRTRLASFRKAKSNRTYFDQQGPSLQTQKPYSDSYISSKKLPNVTVTESPQH